MLWKIGFMISVKLNVKKRIYFMHCAAQKNELNMKLDLSPSLFKAKA